MMKNEVTYDIYEFTKSKWKTIFWLKYYFQNIISEIFNKSLRRIWTRDPWFTRPMP